MDGTGTGSVRNEGMRYEILAAVDLSLLGVDLQGKIQRKIFRP